MNMTAQINMVSSTVRQKQTQIWSEKSQMAQQIGRGGSTRTTDFIRRGGREESGWHDRVRRNQTRKRGLPGQKRNSEDNTLKGRTIEKKFKSFQLAQLRVTITKQGSCQMVICIIVVIILVEIIIIMTPDSNEHPQLLAPPNLIPECLQAGPLSPYLAHPSLHPRHRARKLRSRAFCLPSQESPWRPVMSVLSIFPRISRSTDEILGKFLLIFHLISTPKRAAR